MQNNFCLLTIERLYSSEIVVSEFDILFIALVPRVHDTSLCARVTQPQTVSKLVYSHPFKIHSIPAFQSPRFLAVKMRVTRDSRVGVRVECVGQCTPLTVKRVTIAMVTPLEIDQNVCIVIVCFTESQLASVLPHPKSFLECGALLISAKFVCIAFNLVRKVLVGKRQEIGYYLRKLI